MEIEKQDYGGNSEMSEAEKVLGSMPTFEYRQTQEQNNEQNSEKTVIQSEILNKIINDNPNKYFRQGFFAALSEDKIGEMTPETIMAAGWVAERRKDYSSYKGEQWNGLFESSYELSEIEKVKNDITDEFNSAFSEKYIKKMGKRAVESALALGARTWITGRSRHGYNVYKDVACLVPVSETTNHYLGNLVRELGVDTNDEGFLKKTIAGIKNINDNSRVEYTYGRSKSINAKEALDFYFDTFKYEEHHMMRDVVGVLGYEEFYDSNKTSDHDGSREYVEGATRRPELERYVERVKGFRQELIKSIREGYHDNRSEEILRRVKDKQMSGASKSFSLSLLTGKPQKVADTISLGVGEIKIPDIEEQTKELDIRAEDVIGGHWSEFKYLFEQLPKQLDTKYQLTEPEKQKIVHEAFGNIIEQGVCKRPYSYEYEYGVFHAMEGTEDYSETKHIEKDCLILDAYTGDDSLYDDSYRFVVVKDGYSNSKPEPHYLEGAPQSSTEEILDSVLEGYVNFGDSELRKKSFKGFINTINFNKGTESRQAQWYFEKFNYEEHIDELMDTINSLENEEGYVGIKERFDEFMQIRESE